MKKSKDTEVREPLQIYMAPGERRFLDSLSKETGLSRAEVISQLAKMLPNVVDQMTPDGRLPTQREMERLLGTLGGRDRDQ